MAKSYVSSNQSIFVFGIDPTARVTVDSTKELTATAECVAGFPLVLVTATGKLNTTSAATGSDVYYGVSSSNINTLAGRVSLENWTAARANAEMVGRYTIRPSVFLNSVGDEKTAYPFCLANGGAYTVLTSDAAKAINLQIVTVNNASDAFNGTTMAKWTVGAMSGNGCSAVGNIVAVRDNGEVEVFVNKPGTAFSTV